MAALEPNKHYIISSYKEPPIEVTFIKSERGFYVFLYQNQILPIRQKYVEIIKEIKNG